MKVAKRGHKKPARKAAGASACTSGGRKRPASASARTSGGKPVGASARTAAASRLVADAISAATPLSLPHSLIKPSPFNPRKTFADLQSLADSIREVGVLQRPLLRPVSKKGKPLCTRVNGGEWKWSNVDHYEIVFGERRCRAGFVAGLDTMPVNVAELSDDVVKAIQIIENDSRKDLLVSEQVAAYGQYAEEGKTAEEIKALTFRPLAEVRAILILRRLPAKVLTAIDDGRLGRITAELIARVPGEESRELVAARVLAGQAYLHGDRKAPKPTADSEVLSVRATKDLIHREFQVELKGAPFSRIALDLLEGVPSCDACPSMAGNAAKEDPIYKEVRADTCLDPECFRRKVEAHNSRKIDTLKKDGRKFLAPPQAAKVFSSYDGASLGYSAPYVDLDDNCSDDPKRRTYRALLNGCLPADKVVVGIDRNGDPHELLDKSAAKSLLKETGKIKAKPRREQSASEKRSKEEERIQFEVARGAMSAAAAAGERLLDPLKPESPHLGRAIAAMCSPLAQEFWSETVSKVLRRRKWTEIAPTSGREALGVIAELVACKMLSAHSQAGKGKAPFFEALGIDLKKIEAQVKLGKPVEVQALAPPVGEVQALAPPVVIGKCRICKCVEEDCRGCIARTGSPCSWVSPAQDLCTACLPIIETDISILFVGIHAIPDEGRMSRLTSGGIRCIGHLLNLDDKDSLNGIKRDSVKEVKQAAKDWIQKQLKEERLLDKTPPTLAGGAKAPPAKERKGGASAHTSGSSTGGSSGSKPSPSSASGCPPVEKVVAVARTSIIERMTACLRRKESEVGSVSKEDAPMEARFTTKLVMVKGFPATVAGMFSRQGVSTVRDLLEADKHEDPLQGARKTLVANGASEPQVKTCIDAIETFFRIPNK